MKEYLSVTGSDPSTGPVVNLISHVRRFLLMKLW